MYLRKYNNKVPYAFEINNRLDKKYCEVEDDPKYNSSYGSKFGDDFEKIFCNYFNNASRSRDSRTKIGNGLVYCYNRLIAVLYKDKVDFSGKNELKLAISNWLVPNKVAILKKHCNLNGINSRKNVSIVSQDEINSFVADILSPSMEDYSEAKQLKTSNQFIKKWRKEV